MENYELEELTINDIIKVIEKFAPLSLQEGYDNCGLKCGNPDEFCTGVLITLDTNESVIMEAIDRNCNLIIEHHPLIFNPIKSIDCSLPTHRTLTMAIKNDIAIYSAHTNVDFAENGLNYYVATNIGLNNIRLAVEGDITSARVGDLSKKTTLGAYASYLKKYFADDNLSTIGDFDKEISTVAIINGGGGGHIEEVLKAKSSGADVFVTGDVKYAVARFAKDIDYAIININHFNCELLFLDLMSNLLDLELEIETFRSQSCENPYN